MYALRSLVSTSRRRLATVTHHADKAASVSFPREVAMGCALGGVFGAVWMSYAYGEVSFSIERTADSKQYAKLNAFNVKLAAAKRAQ